LAEIASVMVVAEMVATTTMATMMIPYTMVIMNP
jgi:hypothetical protein